MVRCLCTYYVDATKKKKKNKLKKQLIIDNMDVETSKHNNNLINLMA